MRDFLKSIIWERTSFRTCYRCTVLINRDFVPSFVYNLAGIMVFGIIFGKSFSGNAYFATTVKFTFIIVDLDRVTEIDKKATAVSFPPNVKFICKEACAEGSITALNLVEANIIWIERFAFYQCKNLKYIVFPSTIEEIFYGAFKNCEALQTLEFLSDYHLREIGECAFMNCYRLNSIYFPDNLEIIWEFAFDGCSNLRYIHLNNTKVKYIGENAFGARYFNKTRLPATAALSSLLNNVFYQVEIDESHQLMKKDGNGNYSTNKMIYRGNKDVKHILIRRGVETIFKFCFQEAKLVSLTIPASLIEIQEGAFCNCVFLKHINFSMNSRLRIIKNGAFRFCRSIKRVKFPKSLTIIEKQSFSRCNSLEKVLFQLDSKLEVITCNFSHTSLKELSLPPTVRILCNIHKWIECIYINNDLFASNEERTSVWYSKDGSELIFVLSWLKHFDIPSNVRVIKRETFKYSQINPRISIPASVEVIEDQAFYYCNSIEYIKFEEGSRLHTIGKDAFHEYIKSITLNNDHFKIKDGNTIVSLILSK